MSSSASLIALAILENPRLIPKSKFIVFDAQIYLGSSEPAIITSLRYFNVNNLTFADVGCYTVVFQPARTSSTIEVYSQDLTPLDFHAFGDIVWIIPLGSPENFDMRHHAVVHVAGLPTNINKDDSTFEIHAAQYLSATKIADNIFPVRCLFPDTKRWEKYKPVPGKGKAVSIEGLLTGVERNEDHTVKYFIVNLEKVTFLSKPPVAPKAEESPTKMGTPARLKFTGFFGSQGEESKSEEPKPKKRKTTDDRAQEEAVEDKGEGTSSGRRASTRH
ncbi:hypothetical protein B0H17DRAFT_1218917 [Mycena rosella]|uniref:Uncharacterized protein n=1 Tax=Mycena rosella TaxID=1033263 RepID=A0AAD7FHE8_MYCRO|nr:hypothetical protein B0H17DRAFT_1218917 [Mycena rosella]